MHDHDLYVAFDGLALQPSLQVNEVDIGDRVPTLAALEKVCNFPGLSVRPPCNASR